MSQAAPSHFEFKVDDLEKPSSELLELVGAEIETDRPKELRQAERFDLTKSVPVVPVDEELRPCGEPFMAMTRNISTSGIALVHTHPVEFKQMIVELNSDDRAKLQVLVEVVRCSPFERFFEIGGRYVRKL